ncbi:pickpocket protein 28, partial [Teleopsis dalmanni]|uniref:pickpocket protein 28 n=1 Tax=Teleopsis dalmanni TaxID=139649 RepID=UPI0018CF93D2
MNKKQQIFRNYCMSNVRKFMSETSLHGLKFVADTTITIWERLFFLISFVTAFVIAINLISNIYAKWVNTPVIIGVSPEPTSILQVPFPAITICNMNQVLLSKVSNYSDDSVEGAVMKLLCYSEVELEGALYESPSFKNNNLSLTEFLVQHAQPCSRMLIACKMNAFLFNCSDLFQEVVTDEGLCCVFNVLHPDFLYKGSFQVIKNLTNNDKTQPVDWDPETGYNTNLSKSYYPRPAKGTGVSMGMSLMLNAEIDEYTCSSTNGAGFKVSLHNPIETPHIKETGLTIPIGYETRVRIDAVRTEAVESIRSIAIDSRQCLFKNEVELLYYKYYTRRHCESECQSQYVYENCNCIPYNLPLVYSNSTICTAKESFCVKDAELVWMVQTNITCRSKCLPSCFDLSFIADTFSSPLAKRNYLIPSVILRNMNKTNVTENIAILHFYYRESVFYGELRNIYIGLTEFLSNTGGIMGLFMGFGFISIAEIVYFTFLRPIF